MINQIFIKLENREDLSQKESRAMQEDIISGRIDKDGIIRIFKLFEEKGLTDDELSGILEATREKMVKVEIDFPCLDNCGTGGDGFDTFNISTVSAVVCAAAGIPVAKHGNRAASSQCGSADVLERLGVKINLDARQAKTCLEQTGIVFMFAPNFHPAFKFVKEARAEYGKKTYFNILGPMLNPAGARFQLIGAADDSKIGLIGRTLINNGSERVMIIRGEEGMDEISVAGDTHVYSFQPIEKAGTEAGFKTEEYLINPGNFGLGIHKIEEIKGGGPEESAKTFLDILKNKASAAQADAALLNAAAGMTVFGRVKNFDAGIELAREMIMSGKALKKLEKFIKISNSL